MAIQLKPEIEEIIRQDVQRGAYASADEYLERAVRLLHDRETWLAEERAQITAKIEVGWQQSERGEVISAEEVMATMKRKKAEWLKDRLDA
jgi:putative addiction module CopG family antidote